MSTIAKGDMFGRTNNKLELALFLKGCSLSRLHYTEKFREINRPAISPYPHGLLLALMAQCNFALEDKIQFFSYSSGRSAS